MRYVIRYLISMTKFDDKVLTFATGVDKGRVQTNHQRKSWKKLEVKLSRQGKPHLADLCGWNHHRANIHCKMYTSTCCRATLQTYDNRIEQILKLRSLSCRPQYAACWRSSDPAMFVNTADSSSVFIHVHIRLLVQKLTNATLHTHTHGPPLSGTTRVSRYQKGKNQSGFYWSKRQWVAVASAGPYASLHLAPDR